MKNDAIFDSNNRCISCGEVIPEGRQVCLCCSCSDILLDGKIWKADKTQGAFYEDHLYFSYRKGSCCVDLTLRFGKGNEPTSLLDSRLKSCIYQEHKSNYNY